MTAISAYELKEFNYGYLSMDQEDCHNLDTAVGMFVDNSIVYLTGKAADLSRTRYSQFQEAFSQRLSVAADLADAIDRAIKLLLDYLGDEYDSLDLSDLPDILIARDAAATDLTNAENFYNELVVVETETVVNGETKKGSINTYPNRTIENLNTINNAKLILEDFDALILKLNGLQAVYDEAEKILEEAFAKVAKLGQQVANITPSARSSFVPPIASKTP